LYFSRAINRLLEIRQILKSVDLNKIMCVSPVPKKKKRILKKYLLQKKKFLIFEKKQKVIDFRGSMCVIK
jgi:transposase